MTPFRCLLFLYILIYIYICICVCVCLCIKASTVDFHMVFQMAFVLVVPPHVSSFPLLFNPGEKLGKERNIIKQYCMKKSIYVCTCTCELEPADCSFELCVVGFVAFVVLFLFSLVRKNQPSTILIMLFGGHYHITKLLFFYYHLF